MAATFGDGNALSFPGVTPANIETHIDRPQQSATPLVGRHRGALAGLSPEARKKAIEDHFSPKDESADPDRSSAARQSLVERLDEDAIDHAPTSGLAETLALFPKAKLDQLARAIGLTGISRLNKADLSQRVADAVTGVADETFYDLLNLDDAEFDLVVRLVDGGPVDFGPDDLGDDALYAAACSAPLPPYVFLFKQGQAFTALVPDETAAAVRSVDVDAVRAKRTQIADAVAYAETATTYYGIVDLDAAYRQYSSLVDDPLQPGDFAEAVYHADQSDDHGFALTTRDDGIYLVDFMLSDAFAGPDALDDLETYRDYLLSQQAKQGPRPLDGLVCADAFDLLYDIPESAALCGYLDERVPDDEDDYAYADRMLGDILELFYTGASTSELPADLRDMGLGDCDDQGTLLRLATNLYDALPSWQLHGWSQRELVERETGQKAFYNPDGSVRKVGRNEPCPCGSGKKYKNCCGKGARA